MNVRSGDTVIVSSGNDAGKKGKVLLVVRKSGRVVIEGINLRWKNLRKSQKNPQGGRVQREVAISTSNVLPFCPKCERGVRVRRSEKDGRRIRVCSKCKHALGAA